MALAPPTAKQTRSVRSFILNSNGLYTDRHAPFSARVTSVSVQPPGGNNQAFRGVENLREESTREGETITLRSTQTQVSAVPCPALPYSAKGTMRKRQHGGQRETKASKLLEDARDAQGRCLPSEDGGGHLGWCCSYKSSDRELKQGKRQGR